MRKWFFVLALVLFALVFLVARSFGPALPPLDEAEDQLKQAIVQGKADEVGRLVKGYPELARPATLIQAVTMSFDQGPGRLGVVQHLLEAGVDPNQKEVRTQKSLLVLAIQSRQESVARLLVEKGARDPEAQKAAGRDPKMLALLGSHEPVAMAATPQEAPIAEGTRVLEQAGTLRAPLALPLTDVPPEVQRLLTFNPTESETAWRSRMAADLASLLRRSRLDAVDCVLTTYRRGKFVGLDGQLLTSSVLDEFFAFQENFEPQLASSDSLSARMLLGNDLVHRGWNSANGQDLFTRGFAVLEEATRRGDPDPQLYVGLLGAAKQLGRPGEDFFKRAIELDPTNALAWRYYTLMYLSENEVGTFVKDDALFALVSARGHEENVGGRSVWSRIQKGWEELMRRNPSSSYLFAGYQAAAEWAGDRVLQRALVTRALEGKVYRLRLSAEERARYENEL